MREFLRTVSAVTLIPALWFLGLGVRGGAFCDGLPADSATSHRAPQQYYMRVLGEWVGTAVSRLNGAEPETAYFHLLISRVNETTFREEYTFYRPHPRTGDLECSGRQSVLSTLGDGEVIQQVCRGSGTVLVDYEPKNQTFEASGQARITGPDHLEAEVKGKIAVDGMPMKLGKNGRLRKATASWTLEDGKLVGRTRAETSFRALLFSKRYSFETLLRAQRGTDLQEVAGRAPSS